MEIKGTYKKPEEMEPKKEWIKPVLYTHEVEETLGGIPDAGVEDGTYAPLPSV